MKYQLSIQPPPIPRLLHSLSGGVGALLLLALPATATFPVIETAQQIEESLSPTAQMRAYNPPSGSRSSGNGNNTGGGVRGCGDGMIALAPSFNSIGYSFSTRPTFVWHAGFQPVMGRLEFELYHQSETGETLVAQDVIEAEFESGYMAYTLPADVDELETGETYRWKVNLYCDRMPEQVGKWVEARIQIVEPTGAISLTQTATQPSHEIALNYAQAGFWYDALAQVYGGETSEAIDLRHDLLLDLADLTAESELSHATRWSNQVRQLVE